MRPRILLTILLTALFVILSGCGTTPGCPTCGTTLNGAYAVINVIPVPEHNPNGEPGGPFNSFDISTIAPNPTGTGGPYLDYISDRIGLAMVVIDTSTDIAVNAIQGSNAVTNGGNGASPCSTIPQPGYTGPPPTPNVSVIPPIISVFDVEPLKPGRVGSPFISVPALVPTATSEDFPALSAAPRGPTV